jgi:hypothetical protein
LNWASDVLAAYANRKAIVVSQGMLSSGSPAPWFPDGQYIYDGLKAHTNVFLMLCGHWSRGWRQDTYQGNTITAKHADDAQSKLFGPRSQVLIHDSSFMLQPSI